MSMFNHIQAAPADPILGLVEAFKADNRADKINLGIGVYMTDTGETPIIKAIKEAEKRLLESETSKTYLAIDGIQAFNAQTQAILFGEGAEVIRSGRVKTAQSLGGTGALRIAAEFIKRQTTAKNVWISTPTWPNHSGIFNAVGINIKNYRYYNKVTNGLDWDNLIADLSQAEAGDVVLLHGCCHNPTGIDPTPKQWEQLAALSAEKGWLPLFDFAYQGFANGLEEDAYGLRAFVKNNRELLVANSFSKNFSLYNERVGAFTLIADNADDANRAFTQVKSIIRVLYSNPSAHGASTVSVVLSDPTLKAQWTEELNEMRNRIKGVRAQLVQLLEEKGATEDFSFITEQNGMFSFSGLNPEQVDKLRENFAIYAVRSGRINVAGITSKNIEKLAESIVKVL